MSVVKTIGFVIFRRAFSGVQYLLLHHRGSYWNFPKGRVEANESKELDTAFRELQEETGIAAPSMRVISGFRCTYRYSFRVPGEAKRPQTVTKEAIFYLAEMLGDQAIVVSQEHLGADWFDFDAALQRLYYRGGSKVLRAAQAFLDATPAPDKVKV